MPTPTRRSAPPLGQFLCGLRVEVFGARRKQSVPSCPVHHAGRVQPVGKLKDDDVRLGHRAEPAVAALAGKVADADTSDQFDALVAKLTGDKKTVKRIQKAAKNSAKEYAKQQKKAQGGHKGLLVLGLLVAGGVAGVAAWRASRPVQDPWKTPATASPRVSASPVNTNSTVAAGTGVKVDDVKDPASSVHKEGTASQAAHRATESVKSVAEDAKQTVNEVKEQIKGSKTDDTKLGSPDNASKHNPGDTKH